jgi:hypothetical protein
MQYGPFTQSQFQLIEAMVRSGCPIAKKSDYFRCGDLPVRTPTVELLKQQKLIRPAKPRSRTQFLLSKKGLDAYHQIVAYGRSDDAYIKWLRTFRRQIAKLPGGVYLRQLFGKQLFVIDMPKRAKSAILITLDAASQRLLWKSELTVYPQIDILPGKDWTDATLTDAADLLAGVLDGYCDRSIWGGEAWIARCSEGVLWNHGQRLRTDWVISMHPKRVPDSEKSKHSLQARFRTNLHNSIDDIAQGPLARFLKSK